MSRLLVTIDRFFDGESARAAVVRVTDEHGRQRSYPCPVGAGSAKSIDVEPGLARVELRLPNGHREQRVVKVDPGRETAVSFVPPPSPHEFLAVQSFVSPRSLRRAATMEAIASDSPTQDVVDRIESVRIGARFAGRPIYMGGLRALASGSTRSVGSGLQIDAVVTPDVARLRFDVSDRRLGLLYRYGPSAGLSLTIYEPGGNRLTVSLPALGRFDVILHPNDKAHEPSVDPEVIIGDAETAALLGFLANDDADSADALLDEILDGETNPEATPGRAVIEGYALLGLRRFLAPTTEGALPYVQGPSQQLTRDPVVARLRALRPVGGADGKVLWASAVMQSEPGRWREWFGEVRDALVLQAYPSSVPLLTRGVDYWLNALTQLAMLDGVLRRERGADGDDPLIETQLKRARWCAARLRRNETFTTLWFSKEDFVRLP